MKRIFAFFIVLGIIVVPVKAQHTIEISLVINNTDNNVYVPGVGEMDSSALGTFNEHMPEHFFIASYLNGIVSGIVAREAIKVFYGNNQENHFIGMQQHLGEQDALVALTKGNWQTIDRKMGIIETGKFLIELSPVFGFETKGMYYPVTVLLRYSGIRITGDEYLGTGMLRLSIENIGVSNGNVSVEIRKS